MNVAALTHYVNRYAKIFIEADISGNVNYAYLGEYKKT